LARWFEGKHHFLLWETIKKKDQDKTETNRSIRVVHPTQDRPIKAAIPEALAAMLHNACIGL